MILARRPGAALLLVGLSSGLVVALAGCTGSDSPALFDAGDEPDAGTGGGGPVDAGPDVAPGCDTCGGDAPICVDGDHCADECPDGRDLCNTGAGPNGGAVCCPAADQCCEASVFGYAADKCLPKNEACPLGCPDQLASCAIKQYCEFDADQQGYGCKDECAQDAICGYNLCCPLGTGCTEGACPLPDLTIDEQRIIESAKVSTQDFAADACELQETCIGAPGNRALLRFDLKTPNIGRGDMVLGVPEPGNLFQFSDCHQHFHFQGYANYRLLDQNDNEVASGHKQAFCLEDIEKVSVAANPDPKYTCGYQGIQAGWSDVYGGYLACQWVDVTDVPPGDYKLEVTVNGGHTLAEASYDNNKAVVPVTIPPNTCPGGCRTGDAVCCQPGDPCGWGADGSCDCGNVFGWDDLDCSSCLSGDVACDKNNTCVSGCTPNQGNCCAADNPCNLDDNHACDCAAAFPWDAQDCSACSTPDPVCPVNSCPNGCTGYDPNEPCCASAEACGWGGDGWCDCGGAVWDAADCATCLSLEPDCP